MKQLSKITKLVFAVTTICGFLCSQLAAADEEKWQIRPILGFSSLSDTGGVATSAAFDGGGALELSTSSGFLAGLGLGYRFSENWSTEIAWEYRSNNSSATLTQAQGQTNFTGGDYASNIFHINSTYHFSSGHALRPYIGGGLSWVQEVDLDLEVDTNEYSYSSAGDFGFQAFAGLDWALSDRWGMQAEIRYGSISDIELEAEQSSLGRLTGLDYEPVALQLGLTYRF